MSDIFLSYSREDLAQARLLAEALQRLGWSVWWDRHIPAGSSWDVVIEQAIERARCVIVMWSSHSVRSRWVNTEAGEGAKRDILIPVLIEQVKIPLAFRRIQTADMTAWNGSHDSPEFLRLVEDIAHKLESPETKEEYRQASAGKGPRPQHTGLIRPGEAFRDTLKDGAKGPEMMGIPPGSFQMGDVWGDGDANEKPVHAVHIEKAFALGRYPITFTEYKVFADATGRPLPGDEGWGRRLRPVINVSWQDAADYAGWISQQTGRRYRLPSESQWEYAASSGVRKEKWAGTSQESELEKYAWFDTNSGGTTHPVGEKQPNGFGLHDMSGNVLEWVQDCWCQAYDGAPDNGSSWLSGNCDFRVIRGGSWNDRPRIIRSANRDRGKVSYRSNIVGFRLALEAD